jgi:hypothetical protein
VGPRAGLNDMEELKFLTIPGLELRPLGRPAHSQSLYRLSYRNLASLKGPRQCPFVPFEDFRSDKTEVLVKEKS